MKFNFLYLILGVLFGIFVFFLFMQKEHNTKELVSQIDSVKERLAVLEIQPQTGEDEEKTKLRTQLAEANTKLINADFGKFERELRDSNHKWLIGWIIFFLTVLAVVGTPLWLLLKSGINKIIENLKSSADQLIADEVGKSLNEFEEAVGQVKIQQGQIKILEKEHAVSVLNAHMGGRFNDENPYPEQINILPESALLDIFNDETYHLGFRCWAAEVLASKESTLLVSPLLDFLNSVVDSDEYNEIYASTKRDLRRLVSFLSVIPTQETYEGLKTFLNRLLTENPRHKDLFLTWTVFSLAYVSCELGKRDSVSMIRKTIPDLDISSRDEDALKNLVEYFDKFQEPEGIKEILENGLTEITCLM